MIVLDASVLISHLIEDVHSARALDIIDTEEELAIHPMTLAECLVGPVRVGREVEAMRTLDALGIERLPIGDQQPLALATLRATTPLKLPDCCVLAAAIETGATLATFNTALAKVASEHGVAVAQ
ncbi:MAG: PIN domain-containing protein [Micropruina sp.]|uniref:type II toxin-antitoxin system VapC family toxin n=1 Tax=Micropruina sp. TaxID=2737536 RepID=UPI0039E51D37